MTSATLSSKEERYRMIGGKISYSNAHRKNYSLNISEFPSRGT